MATRNDTTELIGGSEIPTSENTLEAEVRLELQEAMTLTVRNYRSNMRAVTSQSMDLGKLQKMHALYKENSKMIPQFEMAFATRETVKIKPYLEKLDASIDEEFTFILEDNARHLQQEEEHRQALHKRQQEVEQAREETRCVLEEHEQLLESMEVEMQNHAAAECETANQIGKRLKRKIWKITAEIRELEAQINGMLVRMNNSEAERREEEAQMKTLLMNKSYKSEVECRETQAYIPDLLKIMSTCEEKRREATNQFRHLQHELRSRYGFQTEPVAQTGSAVP